MKITADTNILVRVAVADHPDQYAAAAKVLREAETIAITLPALCEFVWVLRRLYKRDAGDIAAAIRRLVESATVSVDRPAVEAGLAQLAAGGDFADGIIAFEGRRLGGLTFASFDADAVKRLKAGGAETLLLPAG
ncbi:MAG TPA: type II toxin-antitoxin system VapC family toxin [Aliidongia sp.]|nr:type II toxin-antitoxin system VapC family toxin [Aliidongia sp.]